jgi:hypothetical protein
MAFQKTAFQNNAFQQDEIIESTSQIDYGQEIRDRLPEESSLQIDGNPGRIMIDKSVGTELGSVEVDTFSNARGRLLPFATGIYLDRYGSWFGITRNGMGDDTYRSNIIALRSSDITIAGLKNAIASILNISIDDIEITNTYPNYCKAGGICHSNLLQGTACKFAGHYSLQNKTMTITLPFGSDSSLLTNILNNLVVPGVTINFD